jgi:homoserine dehydrogenase
MRAKGLDFGVVLKQAQRAGLRRGRPDLRHRRRGRGAQGHHHERHRLRHPGAVRQGHVEGITALQAADIRYAEQLGYRIKLLGITAARSRRRCGIELRVHPTLVPTASA